MSRSKSSARSLAINLVLAFVAFGLLGLAIYSNREELAEVFRRRPDFGLYAAAFAVYLTALVATFGRWFLLVRALGLPFALRDAVRLGFIGNVFNLVIPGAVGGDLIKAAYLVRIFPNRKTQAVSSMVMDRILGLLGLFLLAGVAGAIAWGVTDDPRIRRLIVVVWAMLGAGLVALGLILSRVLTRTFPGLLTREGRLTVLLNELRAASTAYRQRLGTVVGALLMSSGFHALFVLGFYLASRALFPSGLPSLAEHYLIVPLVLFSTAIPLPFGALGLSENISGELFKLAAHPSGVVAMLGFRVLMYAGGLVCACVYLVNLRQVRRLTEEAEHLEDDLESPLPETTVEAGPERVA